MHKFKELLVWQKAMDLSVAVYKITKQFPSEEKFGLVSQINRCSVSIASNIAEGAGRNTIGEFNHFLGIATRSSFELETQLTIAYKLEYLEKETLDPIIKQINDVQNMTFGLKKSFNSTKTKVPSTKYSEHLS